MKNWEKELLGIWEAETQSHRTTARAKKRNWWKAGSKETEKYGGKKKFKSHCGIFIYYFRF